MNIANVFSKTPVNYHQATKEIASCYEVMNMVTFTFSVILAFFRTFRETKGFWDTSSIQSSGFARQTKGIQTRLSTSLSLINAEKILVVYLFQNGRRKKDCSSMFVQELKDCITFNEFEGKLCRIEWFKYRFFSKFPFTQFWEILV